MTFELPTLSYSYDALEPHIDAQTMEIHHSKHHAGYTNNTNKALESYPDLQGKSIESLLSDLDSIPEDIRKTVRNNGGGFYNHTLFWSIMGPEAGGEPSGPLSEAINAAFGDFGTFKDAFSRSAATRFGSGWAWLAGNGDEGLEIISCGNQDNPLLIGKRPILGIDVWEHAYYLKYQNRRPDYIAAWWNVVNWDQVAENFGS